MMLIMFNWELRPALRRLECISFLFSQMCNLYEKQKCSMLGFRDKFRCFTCVSAAKTKQSIFEFSFLRNFI